jgi:endonuclease III-like uncharacterized protein
MRIGISSYISIRPFTVPRNYLMSIHGLGYKSVDCIRLLSLEHKAFPVSSIYHIYEKVLNPAGNAS